MESIGIGPCSLPRTIEVPKHLCEIVLAQATN
jgi:hypothetical protein